MIRHFPFFLFIYLFFESKPDVTWYSEYLYKLPVEHFLYPLFCPIGKEPQPNGWQTLPKWWCLWAVDASLEASEHAARAERDEELLRTPAVGRLARLCWIRPWTTSPPGPTAPAVWTTGLCLGRPRRGYEDALIWSFSFCSKSNFAEWNETGGIQFWNWIMLPRLILQLSSRQDRIINLAVGGFTSVVVLVSTDFSTWFSLSDCWCFQV